KLIKSRNFIILSISTILLSLVIGCFILKLKNHSSPLNTSTLVAEQPQTISDYHSAFQSWLRESPIKNGTNTASQIREQLGKTDLTLYDSKGEHHSYTYRKGIFWDTWKIDGKSCNDGYYPQYNTTPPPKPPEEIKIEYYLNNSIYAITEKNLQSGNSVKKTRYFTDGSLEFINEYDLQSGKMVKETHYRSNGPMNYMYEYNTMEQKIKKTVYRPDNTITHIIDYDPQSGNETKFISYRSGGSLEFISEYEPKSGKKITTTYYNQDGSIKEIIK
ncbi:DUF2963 domain-containing protein, partial [Candidatus Phytoplasma pruni]